MSWRSFRTLVCVAIALVASLSHAVTLTTQPLHRASAHQVTIWWKTDTASTTEVHFGENSAGAADGYAVHSVNLGHVGPWHSRTISNLNPGTYFLRVRSADDVSSAESDELQITVGQRSETTPVGPWVVNGTVSGVARLGSTIYVGGTFGRVGTRRGSGIVVDDVDGLQLGDQPHVAGVVYAAVSDQNGGFYIGGRFTAVGGLPRQNLAHLLADHGVDPFWAPTTDAPVRTLLLSGSDVIVGGDFTQISGVTRGRIAKVNATTGAVNPNWKPNADEGPVLAMVLDGSRLVVGGNFLQVGALNRTRLAMIDVESGAVTSWAPSVNGQVNAMDVSAGQIYFGGTFTKVNGVDRPFAAAIDTSTLAINSWNPEPNAEVRSISVSNGGAVYLGGAFTSLNAPSVVKNYAAAVSPTTGDAVTWNPDFNGPVNAVLHSGTTVTIGGEFTTVNGGRIGSRSAKVDETTGTALSWNPSVNGTINTLAIVGHEVFIGGEFSSAGSFVPRPNAAAFDLVTGELLDWNPSPNSTVLAIAPRAANNTIFLGGYFDKVNGSLDRKHAASVDATSGAANAWNPSVDKVVYSIAVSESGPTAFLGGQFQSVNLPPTGTGVTRINAAAVDLVNGAVKAWDPKVNSIGTVVSIVAEPTRVFLGGYFTSAGGSTSSPFLAAVDPSTGLLSPSWTSPQIGSGVRAMTLNSGVLYVAGNLNSAGGMYRGRLAAIDALSGNVTGWNPNANNSVNAIAVGRGAIDSVVVGGPFLTVNSSLKRFHAAAVDLSSGSATSWNSAMLDELGDVYAVDIDCDLNRIVLGGSINRIGVTSQSALAILPAYSACGVASPMDDSGEPDAGSFDEMDAGQIDAGSDAGVGPPDAGANALALEFMERPSPSAVCNQPYAGWPSKTARLSREGSFSFALEGYQPEGFQVDQSTGAIHWTPSTRQRGSHDLTLAAVAGEHQATLHFNVTVECAAASPARCGCSIDGHGIGLWLGLAAILRRRIRGVRNA